MFYRLCLVTCGVYIYLDCVSVYMYVVFEETLLGCECLFGYDCDRAQKWLEIVYWQSTLKLP